MKIKNLIQIAGIIDKAEAQMLIDCGVDYLAFPLRLIMHKEDLTEAEAAKIIQSLRPPHYGVLITYINKAEEICSFCQKLGTDIVQLHGEISLNEVSQLKKIAPKLSIIKSLIVRQDNLTELKNKICELSPYVTAFITDTYDPSTGATGATGKKHNWNISRKLVEFSFLPVILAGGLNPKNVREAILQVGPAGVDAHTGLENNNGSKSPELV